VQRRFRAPRLAHVKRRREFPGNSDIFAASFCRFWPDLPMISHQNALEKKAIFFAFNLP
jgi:hypothetical protein